MSQAITADDADHGHDGHEERTSTGIPNKKMCMWAFLASDCMFFGTLISTHLIYRNLHPDAFDPMSVFWIELTSFSTFILLMSSFLMALAVSAMHKGQMASYRWNILGVAFFGLIFLGVQVYEFNDFVDKGLTLTNSIFGSTFYVMTGTHGVHVAIGIFWLMSQFFYSFSRKWSSKQAIDVEVAGLYWHFVDIVWIVIFTAVYLLEAEQFFT